MTRTTNPGTTVLPTTLPPVATFRVDAGPYTRRFFGWVTIGVLTIIQFVDAIIGKSVWDSIAGDAEWVSWLIAIGVTGVASLAAFHAGHELGLGHKKRFQVSVSLWLALGLAMAALRTVEPLLTPGGKLNPSDAAVAGIILGLYLLAGTGIIVTASEMHNPKLRQLASARRAVHRTERKLNRAEGQLARVNDTLLLMPDHKQVLKTEYKAALDKLEAQEAELKARARLEIAVVLGRADATSVYRQETWPNQAEPGIG